MKESLKYKLIVLTILAVVIAPISLFAEVFRPIQIMLPGNVNGDLIKFTEEQKAIMQAMCDECYDQFVSIVAKNRGIQYFTCCNISDGRIYTAKQALELRLIDAIDSWENMLRDLAENELKKPGIKVKTYKYEKKQTVYDMITGKALELENAKAAAQLGVPVEVIKSMNNRSMVPMYLAPVQQ